jgi:hypothetical protein
MVERIPEDRVYAGLWHTAVQRIAGSVLDKRWMIDQAKLADGPPPVRCHLTATNQRISIRGVGL